MQEASPPRGDDWHELAEHACENDLRVLVVEDNATNQLVARLMLERIGCAVTLVSDGAEAVAAATHVAYDAILMDCQMPGIDGFEATRLLRQGGLSGVPIVAVTAAML